MGLGCGPKFIPGEPCFQPLLLVAPQRGEGLFGPDGALFQRTAAQLLSHAVPHQAALGTSHSFRGQELCALTEVEKRI